MVAVKQTPDIQQCYQNAKTLTEGIFTSALVKNDAVFAHWSADQDCFWYIHETQTGKEYRWVDAVAATIETITDPQQLSAIASDIATGAGEGIVSPDGTKTVFVRDHNLWLRDVGSGEERPLTEDGTEDFAYAGDRFGSPSVNGLWSPDSQQFFTYQLDQRQTQSLPIVHHIPADGSIRPQLETSKTSLPEDEVVEGYCLVAVDINSGRIQAADYRPLPLTRNGFGFFSAEKMGWWANDSQRAYFVEVERGTQTVRVVDFDTATGRARILFEEVGSSFIKHHLPGIGESPVIVPLPDTDELIWLSERSGYGHLYLYDLHTGECKKAITQGDWTVHTVRHVDLERRQLLIQTTERNPDSPFYRDLCWVNIDTGELTTLVSDNYEYSLYDAESGIVGYRHGTGVDAANVSAVSPSGDYLVVTRSRVDEPPVSLLLDRMGNSVLTLETANVEGLPEHWQWPEPVSVKSADGQSDIYGVVYRPPGFSPEKRYPVIDFSCAHPAFRAVPRSAFSNGPVMGLCFLEAAAFAALGFIVVAMDGPAEPYRRKALQDKHYPVNTGRMASAFVFEDRIAGLKQLATQFPAMDLERVGIASGLGVGDAIYGLLEYPEFYQVGVVADLEDIRFMPSAWNELFIPPQTNDATEQKAIVYAEDQADALQGKLLLIHNMLDPEPPLATTLRMISALKKADKDYDLLLMPTTGHELSEHVTHRSWDYMVAHLLGEKPNSNGVYNEK